MKRTKGETSLQGETAWRSWLLSTAASFFLILLALLSGVFAVVDGFALTVEPSVLVGLCVFSALVSALIYAAPRLSLRLGLIWVFCGLLALYVWWRWDDFAMGAQVLFHQISLTFHEEIPSILYYELPRTLSRAYQRRSAAAFFTVAVPLLSLWLGPWLTLTWPTWPAVGAVAGLVGLPLLILHQPGPLPLAAFLLFLSLVVLSRRGFRKTPSLGGRRVLAGVLPVLLVMALLGTLLPPAADSRPRWLDELRVTLQRIPTDGFAVGVGGENKVTPGEQSFQDAGPLHFDGHTVLQINSSFRTVLFLRGFSAGKYTSQGWKPLDALSPDAETPFPLEAVSTDSYPCFYPALSQKGGVEPASIRVTDMASHSDYVYTPYYPQALPDHAAHHADSYLTRPKDVEEYHLTFLPSVTAAYATVDAEDLLRWEKQYRQWVYANYLDVPYDQLSEEAGAFISSLSGSRSVWALWREMKLELPGGGTTTWHWLGSGYTDQRAQRVAYAQQVAQLLASFTEYDQSTPLTPEGEDFVSWFLTDSHRGYCLHYASAATLILRAMGIPARYTAGYVARPGRASAVTNVPDRNAHAWVEVYVDGFGWVPVDVTPGFSGGGSLTDPTATDPTPSPSPTSAAAAPSSTPTPTPAAPSTTPTAAPTGPSSRRSLPLTVSLLALLCAAVVLFLIYLQYRLRLGRLRKKYALSDPNRKVVLLYLYLTRLRRRAKLEIPPEALDLAQKACFSQHLITNEELLSMEALAHAAAGAAQRLPFFRKLALRFLWALL